MEKQIAQEVTQIDVGESPVPQYALMVRFHHRDVVRPGTPPPPVQTTRNLYLTAGQASTLLLALAKQLGLPGTGIEPTPRH
jgi:hypothetical protein